MERIVILFEEGQCNQGLINILLSLFPECEIQPIYIRLETPLVEKTSFLKKTKT